jgi:hypothetical protein
MSKKYRNTSDQMKTFAVLSTKIIPGSRGDLPLAPDSKGAPK